MGDIPAIKQTISLMTPFLLAATGGLFSQLAGVFNIAYEGLMVNSAFFSILFSVLTGNIYIGLFLGIIATLLLSLLYGFVSLYLKADIFISGLATNLFASSLSIVLSQKIFGQTGSVSFPNMPKPLTVNIPIIDQIPILGSLLSGHNILVYLSWLILILASIVIYRTSFGMRVRATGFSYETARSLGLQPKMIQLSSLLISGFTCGLAGAYLTLSIGAFVPNVSAGRGWIALAIIYLGKQTPVGVLVGSGVFAFVEYLSNVLQVTSNVPAGLLLALPFFVTVLAMIIYSILEYRSGYKVKVKSSSASGGKIISSKEPLRDSSISQESSGEEQKK